MPAYISEVVYAGGTSADFIEIAVDTGTDLSGYSIYVYITSGSIADGPLSLGSVQSTTTGTDAYVVDNNTASFGALSQGQGFALVDDTGNVVQFISFNGNVITPTEGPANGQDSTPVGNHAVGESLQSDDGGSTYYTQTSPNRGTVPCYAPGTMIDTPDGPRAVEDLQVGDLVSTLDHGPQAIRWLRRGDHPLEDAEIDAKPVLIAAGALGLECPTQDLIVSPQHRILVGTNGQLDGWFKSEGFIPSKSLTALKGVRHMKGKNTITWIHFACNRHEVVTANGCLSESLLLGPMVVNGLTRQEQQKLIAIYGPAPTPDAALNGPVVRPCFKVGDVKRYWAECKEENRRATASDTKKWDIDLAMERWEADRLGVVVGNSQKPDFKLAS